VEGQRRSHAEGDRGPMRRRTGRLNGPASPAAERWR
jgi:hypothetical protein